jgi:hypothetical protein
MPMNRRFVDCGCGEGAQSKYLCRVLVLSFCALRLCKYVITVTALKEKKPSCHGLHWMRAGRTLVASNSKLAIDHIPAK